MKNYAFAVKREVSYIEDLEILVSAKNAKEAEELALAFSNGTDVGWPAIDRYNVVDRLPLDYEVINIEREKLA